jgi:hypothetical protein
VVALRHKEKNNNTHFLRFRFFMQVQNSFLVRPAEAFSVGGDDSGYLKKPQKPHFSVLGFLKS